MPKENGDLLSQGDGEPFLHLSHDLVNLKRGQRSWLFFQLGTPGSQDSELAALGPLAIQFVSDLLDCRFPGFEVHRSCFRLSFAPWGASIYYGFPGNSIGAIPGRFGLDYPHPEYLVIDYRLKAARVADLHGRERF